MATGNTEAVRELATRNYVRRSKSAGKSTFSISVAEVKKELETRGFPPNHTPQICNALRSQRFLKANHLELVATDGPPSKTSTTVVFHYRTQPEQQASDGRQGQANGIQPDAFYRMRGMLKDVIQQAGGAEKFLREIRGEDREL